MYNPLLLMRQHKGLPMLFWTHGNGNPVWIPKQRLWPPGRILCLRRYSDAMDMFRNQGGAFSQAYPYRTYHPVYDAMWVMDGPVHRELRNLVVKAFHSRKMPDWQPMVQATAAELTRQIRQARQGRFDLMADFAFPFSLRVICRIMGIQPEEMPNFKRHLDVMTAAPSLDNFPAQPDLVADLDTLIYRYLDHPAAGVMGDVIAHYQNRGLGEGDESILRLVRGYAVSLLAAGTETTANTLVSAVELLGEHGWLGRAVQAAHDFNHEAQDDPLAGMIEEVLRLQAAFPVVQARVTKPVDLNSGVRLKPGTDVLALILAANRDPAEFDDPEQFQPGRKSPHLGFAWGAHGCLGAELARLELRVALRTLLRELPGLRIAPGERIVRGGRVLVRARSAPYEYEI